jgi:hypothetical protein
MAYSWLKLHHDVISDFRMRKFSAQEKWAYVVLMVLASSNEVERGVVTGDDEDLADQCEFNATQDWLYYKDKLKAKGLIDLLPGGIRITNWEGRQGKSPSDSTDATRERKRKQRAQKAGKTEAQNPDSVVETLICHEVSRGCHETDKNRSEEKRLDQTRQEETKQELIQEPIQHVTLSPQKKNGVSRPEGFTPTADNLSKWESEYRFARVPHNVVLYHYDLHHIADGADRRGIPSWKPEAIDGVKGLAKKGRLGSDRKETAMADHEAQNYLTKRLSQLRSCSTYESAMGDLEAAYAEGCAAAKARKEIEERSRSRTEPVASQSGETAVPNPELRKKTHETFMKFMASRGLAMPEEAQQATQAPSLVQSHIQPSQSGLDGDLGAVAA